ncbi:MAG: hypothetical protein HRT35_23890 [Algicola sp.]|nr:hypothetical protein [Algicola sp.]
MNKSAAYPYYCYPKVGFKAIYCYPKVGFKAIYSYQKVGFKTIYSYPKVGLCFIVAVIDRYFIYFVCNGKIDEASLA